ncbi:MAG: hypothetical protein D6760_12585 [Deltaproteobacteria bacterium]|nr:MAG: hypothetical protein D6760_12585 [Deltaproteobacteria bacterium]
MDALLFHPKLVHLPLGLALVMPLLAIGILLARRACLLPPGSWLIVVLLQALLVAGAYGAMRAGHHEEERVEDLVGEHWIHEHEESAEAFVWGAGIVLVVAAAGLVLPAGTLSTAALVGAAAGTLIVTGLAVRAGQSGGELVYERGAAAAYTSPAALPAGDVDDSDL